MTRSLEFGKNFPHIFKPTKSIRSKIIFFAAIIFTFLISCYLLFRFVAKTERGSKVSYNYQNDNIQGIILALPGESFRIHLDNQAVYVKRNGKAYKVIEQKTKNTSANYFETSLANEWHYLGENQYFLKRDPASVPTGEYAMEYEVIKKQDITKTLSSGNVLNPFLKTIQENIEFVIKIDKSDLIWSRQVEGQVSKPIFYNNTIYLTALNNAEAVIYSNGWDKKWSKNNILVALDTTNGFQKWRTNFEDSIQRIYPKLDDSIIYVSTQDSIMHALDKQTGTKLWEVPSFPYLELLDTQKTDIFVTADKEHIFGIEKKTGVKKWSVAITLPEYGEISFSRVGDNILTKTDNNLSLLDPQTGKNIWQYKSEITIVVQEHENYLLVHSDLGSSQTRQDRLRVINKVSGKTIWSHALTSVGDISGITLEDDFVYGIDLIKNQAILWKRHLQSGSLLWNSSLATDGVLVPEQIESGGSYITVYGAYGGSSFEDTTLRRKHWVINNNNGTLLFTKEIVGYNPGSLTNNSLLVFDDNIQSYLFKNGQLGWSYPMKIESHGSWLLNETKSVLYLADDTKVVAVDTENGKELWSTTILTTLQGLSIKDTSLYLQDTASGYLWVINPKNGNIIMQSESTRIKDSNVAENGDVYLLSSFEAEQKREKVTHFSKLSRETKEEKRIFSKQNVYGGAQILYENDQIYVFSDDFVYAIKK
ncbi:MAG: PQQ-binding-like beta-propeller repeat protein [Patescibacteria group bacterium]